MSDNVTNTPPAADNTQGDAAPAVGGIGVPAPKTAPPAPKEIKIKGVAFKSEDDAYAEIERGRQSGKLLTEAQKRLQEASRRDKDFEELVGEVKTKKQAQRLIEKLGLSKEEAVEVFGKYIYEQEILPKELSPEQRRIRELEAKLAQEEETKTRAKKEAEQRELEASTKREEARLREELTKVINDKKIPGTRLALRRLANYMRSYAEAGAEVPVERAADLVMEDYKQEFGELFDEASPDQLAEFFGEQKWRALAKKVSEWALAKARGNVKVPEVQIQRKPKAEKSEKITPAEYQKFLGSIGSTK